MSNLTLIKLPSTTPFPVTIASLNCKNGDEILKHQNICTYKYWDYQDDPNSKESNPRKIRVERVGSYESPIEGKLERVNVKIADEIAHSGIEICVIREPCGHAVQYGGLCALCGKAIEDEKDYTGYTYEDRATIAMSYDNSGLKISIDEATKIERKTIERLNKERKLILVVDLDQTVIHATVDPTVGEWQLDPSNPNYNAVKDVKNFCLEEEPLLPPNWKGVKPIPTKCWYYVKLRPGLETFLREVSKKYEMHIYTMATRSYALSIAKIIDPRGEYFGDRILSRDESGSLTHKDLKRLFPVDQSMVAIIDDRGDVWQWEKNLIKVVPYDFFVGIGDINSSFLPKKSTQITGPSRKRKMISRLEELEDSESERNLEPDKKNSSDSTIDNNGDDSQIENEESNANTPTEDERDDEMIIQQSINRNLSLEQQRLDRPLARLQHDLEKINHEHEHPKDISPEESKIEESIEEEEDKLLFDDDDTELRSLEQALERIHANYYDIYDDNKKQEPFSKPDLTHIIPQMKSRCLEGVTLLFSGILPLSVDISSADIVIWSSQFGARVVTEVYPEVTHVICRDPLVSAVRTGPTFKVRAAKRMLPNVKIVNSDWLFACLSNWRKIDESDYLLDFTEKDWFIEDKDIEKYKKDLEIRKQRALNMKSSGGRQSSIASIDETALDEADQEVDEFLAGLSDEDEDDDEDEQEEEDEEEGEGDDDDEGDDEDRISSTETADRNDELEEAEDEKRSQEEELAKEKEVEREEKFRDSNTPPASNLIDVSRIQSDSSGAVPPAAAASEHYVAADGSGVLLTDVPAPKTRLEEPSENTTPDKKRKFPHDDTNAKNSSSEKSSLGVNDKRIKVSGASSKSSKNENTPGDENMDELERELLDGFDDLED